jgi:hypothetical protein
MSRHPGKAALPDSSVRAALAVKDARLDEAGAHRADHARISA